MILRYQVGPYAPDNPAWDALDLSVRLMQRLEPDAEVHVTHQAPPPVRIEGVIYHAQGGGGMLGRHIPSRFDPSTHEAWFDNDHIIWALPDGWKRWRAREDAHLVWLTRHDYYGSWTPSVLANAGMWGLPPGADWPPLDLRGDADPEQDEMGAIATRLGERPPHEFITPDEVTLYAPDHNVIKGDVIGTHGVHLIGLNRGWNAKGEQLLKWLRREWLDGMTGAWGAIHQESKALRSYHPSESYEVAAKWLNGHGTVADWGCGAGGARPFFDGDYLGIDGSASQWADVVTDLRTCDVETPCLLTRHTLEHNFRWREVFSNMLARFTHRAALIRFTPDSEGDRIVRWDDPLVPYLSLDRRDFHILIDPFVKRVETCQAGGVVETVYLLEKR